MNILIANPRGFCAGVDRAIEITEKALSIFGAPIYVKHEIVHNNYVVKNLEAKGAKFIENIENLKEGSILIFSAHGVSNDIENKAQEKNLKVFNATCPLVTKVHMEVQKYSDDKINTILIGHKGHPEVEGTIGRYKSTDQSSIFLVENINDVNALTLKNDEPVAYVTQTTLSLDDTEKIIDHLKKRFKNLVGPKKEDICYATQNRQNAVKKLSKKCDIILVVGSKNSSNSNRLKEIGTKAGVSTKLVDSENDLKVEWFNNKNNIGLTAGASAPEILIQNIVSKLKEFGALEVTETEGVVEKTTFKIPKELNTLHR